MPRRRLPAPLIVLLPLLLGVSMLVGAIVLALPTIQFVTGAGKAEGTYVGAVALKNGDSVTYKPRFRFQAADGSIVSFTAKTGSRDPTVGQGTHPSVYYDPASPEKARLGTIGDLWIEPLKIGGAGLMLSAIGAFVLVRYRRRRT